MAVPRPRKRDLKPFEFLPKALAWWFALCGRVGIPDVEDMLWAKYPSVCPYCRKAEHKAEMCKEKREDHREIDWKDLTDVATANKEKGQPRSLLQWQQMFNTIYPRTDITTHETNISRISEEFGELAEAVRGLPVAPAYFLSEAPDVFAWFMGFANQFAFDAPTSGESLEEAMERHYPGYCTTCSYPVCKCPPIPASTLGRMAKAMPVPVKSVFPKHSGLFSYAEAIDLFSQVERSITIDNKPIRINRQDIEDLARDMRKVLEGLQKQDQAQVGVSVQVAASLGRLELLAQQGTVTQESIQHLLEEIRALPPARQNALVGFLTSLSASAMFQAILEATKAFNG
jgi:NTP pyrophosphatase (non-canonical NTP hydrolase)